MSNIEIGVAGIAIALALIALRVPIGVALGLVSIIGIGEMTSMRVAWGMISATPFDFAGTWELTAAPMFLFMGYLCTSTNMTQGLFHAMRLYLARLPGGLAVSSVMASAFFAAASGSSVATSAAMSRIAVPEMLKHHYDKGLATGTVAASGTLGSLIPPKRVAGTLWRLCPGVSGATVYGGIHSRCTFSAALHRHDHGAHQA